MMTFREFLQKKAEQPRHKERRERKEEWVAAVSRLIDQIRAWLAESDPDQVLDVIPLEVEKWEPGLGTIRIPSLEIAVGNTSARVDPVGREAIGAVEPRGRAPLAAAGRVDITNGFHRHILYRTLEDGKESWYVLNDRFEAAPFGRPRLEAILQDLLS